ncbi:MAG: IS1634 family transposase [Nitrospinota bacterium]
MYIDTVPNRNSPPTILLRESYREGKKVKKRTIANITKWPSHMVDGLRILISGKKVFAEGELIIEKSTPHGHVEAILGTMKKLGMDTLLSSQACKERNLVMAMIAERLIHPCSKLATTRTWNSSTLAEELGVDQADEDDLYTAMDWLVQNQSKIEGKLAKRHLKDGALALYDISSSYYEGRTCPLIAFGHNRDGKKGKQIIVYGLMADADGRPIAMDVYPGNTADPTTIPDQIEKLSERFNLSRVVLVGDRGMLTQTQIEKVKQCPSLGWISALRSRSIQELVEGNRLQLSLFDQQDLAEITSPDYPGERLVACFNPFLAEERKRKRLDLLEATENNLKKISQQIERRKKKKITKPEIGLKVGKVINRYKVGKHFKLAIDEGKLSWQRNENNIEKEASLDGIYVIRTSEPKEKMSAEDAVRNYKSLSQVERAFRSLKSVDTLIRPIRHRKEVRVKAHIFLCMLAYYVEWHMRKALKPLLFEDEELEDSRKTRDPVAPAKPSQTAKDKKKNKKTKDGFPVHSLKTLLIEMGTRCKNLCKIKSAPNAPAFTQLTELNPFQKKVFQLLDL